MEGYAGHSLLYQISYKHYHCPYHASLIGWVIQQAFVPCYQRYLRLLYQKGTRMWQCLQNVTQKHLWNTSITQLQRIYLRTYCYHQRHQQLAFLSRLKSSHRQAQVVLRHSTLHAISEE